LFYDRYPLAYLNEAVQKDGRHGFEQYLAGEQAVRAFVLSAGGSLAAPLAGGAVSIYLPDGRFPTTYGRKFAAGAERKLDRDTTVTAEYSYVLGFHLPRIRNTAGSLPPRYGLEQTSRSEYHGLSLALNRRLSKELTYLLAYSVGRARDDASDYDEQPLNPLDVRQDWSLSRQDQRHRIAFSGLFEWPAEELKRAPAWFREGFGSITLAPVFSWASGRPVNTLLTTDAYRTGAYPISARPAGFARNGAISPRTMSFDLRVMKTVLVLNHRAWLQFGAEAFNLLNHTNRLRVSPYYTSTFAQPVEVLNPRQVQLMIQIEY
jgi:hypothetical protein